MVRKKFVFRLERNIGNVEQERSAIGSEFQTVGAANVHEAAAGGVCLNECQVL